MSNTANRPNVPSPGEFRKQELSRFKAVALDYDGTIAEHGRMDASTEAALRSLRVAGFSLILVSGRRLENLRQICGALDLFDTVILENGAVSFCPATGTDRMLAPEVDKEFLAELSDELPNEPLFVGRSMIAAASENTGSVEAVIALGGYGLDIIGCGRRVLILPKGTNKASGLSHALGCLGLQRDQVIAVGDEENDIELLNGCGLAVVVGNAAPALKAVADIVLPGESGQSIRHLTDMLLSNLG